MLRSIRSGDHSELVRLLDQGMDCDQTFAISGSHRSALCLALEQGHTKIVEELCKRRCSVSMIDQGGLTPIHLAASLGKTEIVHILLENRADIDACAISTGDTALHMASSANHLDTVTLLLQKGANVNKQNNEGQTCLMQAARNCHSNICNLLLSFGARKSVSDIRGNTALLLYCNNAKVSTSMIEMLSSPIVMDKINWDGWWPLLAVLSGSHQNKIETMRCLVRKGADVNVVSSLGTTALHTALYYNYWETARFLIRAGADATRTDYLGNTPLSLALSYNNLEMANIIIAAGAPCHIAQQHRSLLSEDARLWLMQQDRKTKTLKEISRLAVRNIFIKKMETFLVTENIPKTLKQYVYFLLE